MSVCLARGRELAFLVDPIGPGTAALAALEPGDRIAVLGPLGRGFRRVSRPLLVGGGIGVAPLPYLSEELGRPPAVLGFRSDRHAEAAALVPNAEVVVEPTLVTERLRPGREVLACGPEPMLQAIARLVPSAQLAWEAPMACGYGACYGCAVEIRGALRRLCIEGPVVSAADAPPPAAPAAADAAGNGRGPSTFPLPRRRVREPVSAAEDGEAA
jgi:dihydroorotate dehydrogenase electron transfer subunit